MAVQRYRVLKKLGEGGCGRTWLVRDRKLGKLWAMKEWREKEGAQEELRILRELESPCFPRIVECFQENGRQYLLMDWIRGGRWKKRCFRKVRCRGGRLQRMRPKSAGRWKHCMGELRPSFIWI